MFTVRFLKNEKDNSVNSFSNFIFVLYAVLVKINQEVHEYSSEILEAMAVLESLRAIE